MANQNGEKFLFHLKDRDVDTKPAELGGRLHFTLCSRWVYDSIAADADCADRWVTCPKCSELDPKPANRGTPPPSWT